MTIVDRTLSTAFLHRPEVHPWGARTDHVPVVTEARADGASSRITAAPWEGLYLEVDQDVDAGSAGADGLTTEAELIKVSATDTWDDSGAPHP